MSSTNMSYYAILRDYLFAVKSASRRAVSSDGAECVGGPFKDRIRSSRFVRYSEATVSWRNIALSSRGS
jgi:hypothetical protein